MSKTAAKPPEQSHWLKCKQDFVNVRSLLAIALLLVACDCTAIAPEGKELLVSDTPVQIASHPSKMYSPNRITAPEDPKSGSPPHMNSYLNRTVIFLASCLSRRKRFLALPLSSCNLWLKVLPEKLGTLA